MKSVRFELNQKNAGDAILRKNGALQRIQQQALEIARATATAQFRTTFKRDGEFVVIPTGQNGNRINFTLKAADPKTAATLAKNPRWLAQFVDNIKI